MPTSIRDEVIYRLTWPTAQPRVCCIAEQWRRNEQGEIEAWYTAEQLAATLETMQAIQQPLSEAARRE